MGVPADKDRWRTLSPGFILFPFVGFQIVGAGWPILFSVMILPFVNDTSLWVPRSALFRGVRVSNNYRIACVWLSEAANSRFRRREDPPKPE